MSKEHPVTAIASGTVIDHIPQGRSLMILQFLNIEPEAKTVLVGMNLSSNQLGVKDLIKLADVQLTQAQVDGVAIFAQSASINVIDDFKVVEKKKVSLPKTVESLLVCPNAGCITKAESVSTRFHVDYYKNDVWLQCDYCECLYPRAEINEYNL